jgi:hypothetical protein
LQHEQSFADTFNTFMRGKASEYGCRFHSFSVDGQDRDARADYLLTDSDRFAIVEFKYSSSSLVSEKYKPRRLKLCQKLVLRQDMQSLHDLCHFISWTEGSSMSVKTNIYRHEICNRGVFGDGCGLSDSSHFLSTRASAGLFATDFFNPIGSRSLSLAEFETYLAWVLTETSASTKSTLELVAHNPASNDLALVRLNSIAEAQTWVRNHVAPPPSPRYGI